MTLRKSVEIVDDVLSKITSSEELEFPINDIYYWIQEAMQHITSHKWLVEKAVILDIEEYRAELPCDFAKLIAFHIITDELKNKFLIDSTTAPYVIDEILNTYGMTYGDPTNKEAAPNKYWISKNCVNSNVEKATIGLSYYAFPVDEEGIAMVPNDPAVTDALFYRICYFLAIRGFMFKNKQFADIQFLQQNWIRSAGIARSNLKVPTKQELDTLARNVSNPLPYYRKWR